MSQKFRLEKKMGSCDYGRNAQLSMSFTPDDSQQSETSNLSLIQLVLQAQAGQQDAFEELYKQYFRQICNYLTYMTGDNGVACELAQEAFIKAWQSLPGLREPATFVSWLYRIATNLARDHQRKTRDIRVLSFDALSEGSQPICSEQAIEAIEAQDHLKRALAALPRELRACLILYHLQNVPKDLIADYIGVKKNSTNTYLSAALKKLRQLMAENFKE